MKRDTTPPAAPAVTPELLERARAKDRDALADLYEATSLEIYRTIHALVKDEDLTLDVQQDAYLLAFSHLDQLRKPESFLPWLRQIAVNEARIQLRKKRPLLFSEMEPEPEGAEPELPDVRPEASPELSLDRKETSRMVQEILNDLSDGQRMLVGMYYYEQIPVSKIAEDTGLSVGTVKTQLYRGRKKVEAAVKRLEEKGVKLYGLSPLPFLLALLKRQEPAAEAGKSVLTGALTRAGVAPAAEAAAIHVGRSFFETVLGKVVLGVLAAGVIGGGAAGYRWYQNHFNVGDYQPPSETLEINLHYDSDEDLTTEPTTEPVTTAPETPEDLSTEPPESTDPVETTDPVESTYPVGADAHIGPNPTDPTEPPAPTDPAPTDPQPTQPAPQPANPVPAVPTEPDPTTEPTEIGNVGTTLETLPTTNPYPESLGTVYMQKTADGVWTYSYQTDEEMEVSQFVFSNAQISNILVSSAYANGTQTITVNLSYAGTCTIGIRIPDFYWYKLVTLIIQDSDE